VPAQPGPRHVRIAALQPELKPEGGAGGAQAATANMLMLRRVVEGLVANAPLDLVVLPEAFAPVPLGVGSRAGDPVADHAAGVRQFLGHLARACEVNVIGGSVEQPMPPGRPRNSCFVIDRQGREVGRYDKRTLFSLEADRRSSGQGPGIFELDGVRVGVLICGDLWRPELARELVGAVDVLCVPAMTAVPSDRHIPYAHTLWLSLALTRAMESALAVVVSDWAEGRHNETFLARDDASQPAHRCRRTYYTCGAGSICDPGHRPHIDRIQRVLPDGQTGAVRADIDLGALAEYRAYRRAVGLLPLESGQGPD